MAKVEQRRFIDQLDGEMFAETFIAEIFNRLAKTQPLVDIEERNLRKSESSVFIKNHMADGRVTTLWDGETMIAIANVMRTPMNYTHVVCTSLEEENHVPNKQ